MDCDEVAGPAVEHTDVHAMAVHLARHSTIGAGWCDSIPTLCVGAGSIVHSCHHTCQAGLADAVHHIPEAVICLALLTLLTSGLGAVSVSYVSLQVPTA